VAHRSERLKRGLRKGESVTGALYDAGYGSSSRMYEQAPTVLGMTPSLYKKGGAGMKIHYTVVDSSLGKVLVGATKRGVCAVSLGSSEGELQSGLRREYPKADMRPDDGELGEWTQAILRHIEGKAPHVDLPLDVQATAFQHRVWEELRKIPYGSTRSYGEVARGIGQPGASRAVAQACASNHVALLVPCHRVVRENGGPGGYRWGVWLKLALLKRERAVAQVEAGEE
jgi:AraC family transcriptional regulator of adaptative response/methylated-DNA-[protein]-cysteine methyltransferase